MMFSVSLSRSLPLLLAGLILCGCLPSPQSQLEEEKEPHFITGKSRVNAMDYKGAIESFQKALEVNPRSASAHFELGWLFDRKEPDPAAAIYHYEQYLRLRSKAENAEIVKQQIVACKQEVARTVSLGPITEKQQRDLEKLAEENKQLTERVKLLDEEVAKWRAYYAGGHLMPTNSYAAASASGRGARGPDSTPGLQLSSTAGVSPSGAGGTRPAGGAPVRTHTVQAGETLSLIARKYSVRLDALTAANPRLDARRLRPGQTLTVPGS